MSWQILRPQIVTLLNTVNTLAEVSPTPKVQFNAYPSAHVVPSDNDSDYETTAENVRQYAWTVRVFYETKNGGIENAYTALEQVVDAVVDLFDQEDLKTGNNRTVGVGLPANYTYLNIFAVPSRWAEVPEVELLMAEIIIRVRISVDVT